MKSLDHSSIRPRAATLFSATPGLQIACFISAAAVLAVALCTIFFPQLLRFAALFAQAGIVVSIAAGVLSVARKKALQQRRRLAPVRTRRRD